MATPTVIPSHITVDENGVARIDGTRMKVRHLIEAMKSMNATPQQLFFTHPALTHFQRSETWASSMFAWPGGVSWAIG